MSGRTYGRIRLDETDLTLIRTMLKRAQDDCAVRADSAADLEEKAFYAETGERASRALDRFEAAEPGIASFTESDLSFVRGLIFPLLFPELMAQYARRSELTEAASDELSARIDHLSDLERRFDAPRVADRSQDPEPEEDDDEDVEADAAPEPR